MDPVYKFIMAATAAIFKMADTEITKKSKKIYQNDLASPIAIKFGLFITNDKVNHLT